MSKAEEKAMEKYPPRSVLIVPARGGGYYADKHLRDGYIEGYRQAEKDLELTWEDIDMLLKISPFVDEQHCDNKREFCEEVLKRFKAMKEK